MIGRLSESFRDGLNVMDYSSYRSMIGWSV